MRGPPCKAAERHFTFMARRIIVVASSPHSTAGSFLLPLGLLRLLDPLVFAGTHAEHFMPPEKGTKAAGISCTSLSFVHRRFEGLFLSGKASAEQPSLQEAFHPVSSGAECSFFHHGKACDSPAPGRKKEPASAWERMVLINWLPR